MTAGDDERWLRWGIEPALFAPDLVSYAARYPGRLAANWYCTAFLHLRNIEDISIVSEPDHRYLFISVNNFRAGLLHTDQNAFLITTSSIKRLFKVIQMRLFQKQMFVRIFLAFGKAAEPRGEKPFLLEWNHDKPKLQKGLKGARAWSRQSQSSCHVRYSGVDG